MGKKRAPSATSASPTADRILLEAEVDDAIRQLTIPHRRRDAYRKLRGLGPLARAAVEEGLLADDPELRVQCTILIDRLAGNDSFELMMLLLDDPDPRVRLHAIHALACDRCKAEDVCAMPPRSEVVAAAARLLAEDPHSHVRTIALEVLARWVHDDDDARAAIEAAAERDPTPSVRKKATWYLPGGKIFERTRPRRVVSSRAR